MPQSENQLPPDVPKVPNGWTWIPLRQLVDVQRGISYGIVQPGSNTPGGVPIVRVNNLQNHRVVTDNVMAVSPDVEKNYARTRLHGGEVLLSLVGSLGESAVAPSTLSGWNTARAVAVIPVLDDPGPHWVELCLRSPVVQHYIRTWATTTVQATLNLRDVAKLPIPLPPVHERRTIMELFRALDDKIELNRRMNETLEAMARALFKSWFVDFDPVKRNQARKRGEAVTSSEAWAKEDALFPDSLQDSPLGKIPKSWSVHSLDEVAHFLNGLALQKYPPDGKESLPVIKIAQLRKGNTEGADQAAADIPSDHVVEDGDVLFSWSGSLEVVIWCGGRGALNQHLFKVTSKQYPKWFYYFWIREHLPDFQAIASGKATTMGHIQRHHLSEAKVLVPPPALLQKMNEAMGPLLHKMEANSLESRTLAAIRDTLLPKLISGEIRVKDAEKLPGAKA